MNSRKIARSAAFKGGIEDEYQYLLDYWTLQGYTLPSDTNQIYQNQLIRDFKGLNDNGYGTTNLLTKMLSFALFANENTNIAKTDWQDCIANLGASSNEYVLVNSPTFTSLEGYTGNGTSSYILTNKNINSASGTTHGYMSYVRSNPQSGWIMGSVVGNSYGIEVGRYIYFNRTSGDFSQVGSPYTTPAALGGFTTSASTVKVYKTKTIGTSLNQNNVSINKPTAILARYLTNTPTFGSYSTAQISAQFFFIDFDEAMYFQLYDSLQHYMTSIGKAV